MAEVSRVTAFFNNNDDAHRAIRDLRDEGFRPHEIGCALGDAGEFEGQNGPALSAADSPNTEEDRSFWDKVTDFFTGHDEPARDHAVSAQSEDRIDGRALGVPGEYQSRLGQGRCLVTVETDRFDRANELLVRAGGVIEQGFRPEYRDGSEYAARNEADDTIPASRSAANLRDDSADLRDDRIDTFRDDRSERDRNRIQLVSERLQANKQRVQSGEATIRKEVVTEQQNITVPVQREELVIDRQPVNQSDVSPRSAIGEDREIRVLLSEERVTVEKQPYVTEEVAIGKKSVQEERNISDQVKHEELHVDTDKGEADPLRKRTA